MNPAILAIIQQMVVVAPSPEPDNVVNGVDNVVNGADNVVSSDG